MADTSFLFSKPQRVQSLKDARLWSPEFCESLDGDFRFFILEKLSEGGYLIYGQADCTDDAFRLRRRLADDTGRSLFLRAKRRERPMLSPDSDAAYDAVKDYWSEGRAVHEVPAHLQPAFRHFCRNHGRSAR